jgi:hypothetical protein
MFLDLHVHIEVLLFEVALRMRARGQTVKCVSCMKSMPPRDFRAGPGSSILMKRREGRLLSR